MSKTTRAGASKAVFAHLLSDILEIDDTEPVALALSQAGITKMTQLISITEPELRTLTYTADESSAPKTLQMALARELFNGIAFYKSLDPSDAVDEWLSLQGLDFITWLANPTPDRTTIQTTPTLSLSPPPTTDVARFTQQIRRNPTDFISLKKDSEWSNWNRALLATANAQGVQTSYDLDYTPTVAEEPLFRQHQIYNYSVLRAVVLTPFGIGAVRQFETTFDAQGVYRALSKHYATGVTASIKSQALEEELIGMRLDGSHRKGCEHFLNVWHLKAQELDSIRATIVPDPQKKIWLTSALQTHPLMSAAITQASTMEYTMAGLASTALKTLDFHTFFELCITTAQHIDKSTQVQAAKQRKINHSQTRTRYT